MGKAIEAIALERGHEILLKITSTNLTDFNIESIKTCDVAIEFTNPESVINNLYTCMQAQVPVVCGSTGWVEKEVEIKKYCNEKNASLLFASNFSIGVNLFFEINKKLASLMAKQIDYNVAVEEIHHTQKKDAPSGTAITIAQQIIAESHDKENWVLGEEVNKNDLSIISKRIDPAPGTHIVTYNSLVDEISISHTAHSRQGFALGAVVAAEFLQNKKGVFSMQDVLKESF